MAGISASMNNIFWTSLRGENHRDTDLLSLVIHLGPPCIWYYYTREAKCVRPAVDFIDAYFLDNDDLVGCPIFSLRTRNLDGIK